jgi:cellulose synthase (UDP-forming)
LRVGFVRLMVVVTVLLGANYLFWRATSSLNMAFWPLAFALLAAELFSFVDTLLFGVGMWKWRRRGVPPPARGDETVDVFVTCYNEPVELVRQTVRAAVAIRHPHRTYVLDDGESPAMRRMAEDEGARYIVRAEEWRGRERHAKAGNLNNALFRTAGEFILVQDADQIPHPDILDETLGYFRDPTVAFVQTPQWFRNVPPGDPFGSQAPLFYGPIQEGKDGWNAAFFCGSNAVLRREALFQAGMVNYARDRDLHLRRLLRRAEQRLRIAERALRRPTLEPERRAVSALRASARRTARDLRRGVPVSTVAAAFEARVREAAGRAMTAPMAAAAGPDTGYGAVRQDLDALLGDDAAVRRLADRRAAPLSAVALALTMLRGGDDGIEGAMAMMPIATISVTEDMATAMRIHALGWTSVFHPRVLASGLAPEDLSTALGQRLRWAQGTIQVLMRENPLTVPGLRLGQRLSYLATMWSYLSGFPTVVYLLVPVLFLTLGWTPVTAWSGEFFARFVPYFLANQLLFLAVSFGLKTWRGRQYSVALFPVWIEATVSAARNVWFGRDLSFLVTAKQRRAGPVLGPVRPQLIVIALLWLGVAVGLAKLAMGLVDDAVPVAVNVLWALYDIAILGVLVRAILYRAPAPEATAGLTPSLAPTPTPATALTFAAPPEAGS